MVLEILAAACYKQQQGVFPDALKISQVKSPYSEQVDVNGDMALIMLEKFRT